MPAVNYQFEDVPSDNEARFCYQGQFQNQQVTWHVHLITCTQYKQLHSLEKIRQFIKIEPAQGQDLHTRVCLNLKKITKPDIVKTIIMLNQYKRLALGTHEFGNLC